MRNTTLLATRLVLGGYLAAHGAQKLFGSLDGPGLDATAQGFESMGLTPGREMATLASASEIVGGVLTATGIAHPIGPLAVASTMAVASTVHRQAGPMAAAGGYELPLTFGTVALALAAVGPGSLTVGPAAPKALVRTASVVGGVLAGVSIGRLILAGRRAPAAAGQDEVAPAETPAEVSEPEAVPVGA